MMNAYAENQDFMIPQTKFIKSDFYLQVLLSSNYLFC